jgi:hypothetical protein
MRRVIAVILFTFLGLLIGVALAVLLWWHWLAARDKSVWQGLSGRVEDGLGSLQGLTALGILVGGPVGLVYGLIKTPPVASPKT